MGYRRALLVRWSRRDRLAVLVVGVTVAFLTGATVLLFAVGAQTASVAAEFDSPGSVEYVDGVAEAGPGQVVLPVTVVESNRSAGEWTVVGVPERTTLGESRALRVGEGTTLGAVETQRVERLRGADGTVIQTVTPRNPQTNIFPPSWYVTDTATVRTLGASGAFVVDTEALSDDPEGAPLLGALAFFLHGTREAVGTLGATAAGAALLIAVTVYSVSRMSVRDRLATIEVVRATGGTPRTVLSVFALRAGLLTAVGIALGYAIGVITASGAVNVAVAVGLPTALPVGVTSEVVRVLVPLYAGLGGVGVLAGMVAAYPVVTCPPGQVTAKTRPARESWVPAWASLEVLGWRTLVPTTATLTTFVAFVVLVAGLAGAAGPVFATDSVTVTDSEANHPINSRVPAAYADAVRDRGIEASGEILLFEAVDGQPFTARGAVFGPFANVSDAELVAGRPHTTADEAVIGAGLARTLDVEVGESLTLGGSTRESIVRVEVVGVFEATGATDDQLVVSLATARHLGGVPDETVQFVRAERLPADSGGQADVVDVVGIGTGGSVVANESFEARVLIRNLGLTETEVTVPVRYRGQQQSVALTVPPTATRQASVSFEAGTPGEYGLKTGNRSVQVRVRAPDALIVGEVPDELPVGAEPLVRVTDASGAGVGGATITVANQSRQTSGDGRVRLPPLEAGQYTLTVRAGDSTTREALVVRDAAERTLAVDVGVRPAEPSLLDRPTARVGLSNPWNRTLARTVVVSGPETTEERTVRLGPGERQQFDVTLPRRAPGAYVVAVRVNETFAVERPYRVTGDDRIAAALASSGRDGSSGVGQAAEAAFGNLQVVLGALFGLAGLMTVGGTTAAFAGAVHARRQTLGVHRATGAAPLRVLQLVLWDAARLGLVGSIVAAGLAQVGLFVLGQLGYLTAFGVRLSPTLETVGLLATVLGGLGLTLLGAGLATAGVLAASPTSLLTPQEAPTGGEPDG